MPEDGPIIVYVVSKLAHLSNSQQYSKINSPPFFNSVSTHHNMILDPITLCMFCSFGMLARLTVQSDVLFSIS